MRVSISNHGWYRWKERVEERITKKQLRNKVHHVLTSKMREGLKPHCHKDGQAYFTIFIGKYNERLVFAVLVIGNCGWLVVTFITDEEIDNISEYFNREEEKAGG